MRLIFLFLSSLLFCPAYCQTDEEVLIEETQTVESPLCKRVVSIDTGKATISGILVTRETEKVIMGSIINEFGISALDFCYDKRKEKMKLTHVVSFLNKWYIKKVRSNDRKFCLHILYGTSYNKKHNYRIEQTVNSTTIYNTKRHITYTFSPLKEQTEDEISE